MIVSRLINRHRIVAAALIGLLATLPAYAAETPVRDASGVPQGTSPSGAALLFFVSSHGNSSWPMPIQELRWAGNAATTEPSPSPSTISPPATSKPCGST